MVVAVVVVVVVVVVVLPEKFKGKINSQHTIVNRMLGACILDME